MSAMVRRIAALERAGHRDVSPLVKHWLGWPLTETEQALVDEDAGVEPDWDAIDTSDWSPEMKRWLEMD